MKAKLQIPPLVKNSRWKKKDYFWMYESIQNGCLHLNDTLYDMCAVASAEWEDVADELGKKYYGEEKWLQAIGISES